MNSIQCSVSFFTHQVLLIRTEYATANTLLGEPRKLICQCCGMPIDDDSILGRDKDGTLNEEYCKWCYADGTYTYNDMDELIDVCVKNMVNENFTEEQAQSYLKEMLPKLDYWKRYDELRIISGNPRQFNYRDESAGLCMSAH